MKKNYLFSSSLFDFSYCFKSSFLQWLWRGIIQFLCQSWKMHLTGVISFWAQQFNWNFQQPKYFKSQGRRKLNVTSLPFEALHSITTRGLQACSSLPSKRSSQPKPDSQAGSFTDLHLFLGFVSAACILLSYKTVLVLARTGLHFAVARQGHGLDLKVILYHLMSFSRNRGRCPFWVRVLESERLGIVGLCVVSVLVHSVINTVAVTIHFLISLPFPVNCSYLSLWSLPLPPILLSSPLQGWGGGGGSLQARTM